MNVDNRHKSGLIGDVGSLRRLMRLRPFGAAACRNEPANHAESAIGGCIFAP
ncbi:hypothetical protein [Bosea sp. (in: a-proteobacteria)]|uniref:hypothetical protein n=1 Tax=Bosea sp. (in: a-proteobacteria) TaxID=1871050 RepID=UPI003B3B48DF